MRLKSAITFVALFALLGALLLAQATIVNTRTPMSQTGVVDEMQMLASSTGWARIGSHVLWTSDNGQTWRDITPAHVFGGLLSALFFLNSSNGWAVISNTSAPGTNTAGPNSRVMVASTTDEGTSWSTHQITVANPEFISQRYGGQAYLSFPDAQHGWLELRQMTSTNFSEGVLLATIDGGNAWTQLPNPPICDRMRFISPAVGWISGGVAGDQLYLTKDGGEHWQQQTINPPSQAAGADRTFYDLPSFPNPSQGFLSVTFVNNHPPRTAHAALATFAVYTSTDGGLSWQLASVDWNLPVTYQIHAAAFESGVIKAFNSNGRLIIGPHAVINAPELPANVPSWVGILSVSFIDASNGWLLVSGSRCAQPKQNCSSVTALLATADSGKTVMDITPSVKMSSRIRFIPSQP